MTENKKIEVFQKAIDTYGMSNQIDMCIEEIGEFLQALNKIKRAGGMLESNRSIAKPGKNRTSKYSILYYGLCSEVADVKIMFRQVELMLDPEAISISESRKIERLVNNLNESKKPK